MPKIHDDINIILNDFTQNFYPDEFPEIIDCLLLDIKSCVEDDLVKSKAIGDLSSTDIFKMQQDDLREFAKTLQDENAELKKILAIKDYFEKHQQYFHHRDHERLLKLSERYILNKGVLSPDDLQFLLMNGNSDVNTRREIEDAETEQKNRLIRLGNIKTRIKK